MKMQNHCHSLIVFLIAWSASLPGACAEEVELPLPAEPKHGRPNLMPEAERHWAYLPLGGGALPVVNDKQWGRNPIDRFVLARLEKEDIKPSPRAAPHILILSLIHI